jgi:4'-phosphopantetheinyl transferase
LRVYWIEQTAETVPDADEWLSAPELLLERRFHIKKRRTDWRLGRWTAKQAIAAYLELQPDCSVFSRMEIRANPAGVPEALLQHRHAPFAISLSHCGTKAICAIASNETHIGCDIEVVAPRPDCFVDDYFTHEEQLLIEELSAAERPILITLFWSAKESALKALGTGLRRDTRSVSVHGVGIPTVQRSATLNFVCTPSSPIDVWFPLKVTDDLGRIFNGWWRYADGFVRTLVADRCLEIPIELQVMRPEPYEPAAVCEVG